MHALVELLAPLNAVLFTLGDDHVSIAELLGFVSGAACVGLTVKQHVANFAVGIANAAFFLVLFLSARLYADSALQLVYIALGFSGWWQWLRGGASGELSVNRASTRLLAGGLAAVVVLTAGLTLLLRAVNDVAPFLDALTTSLSLVAQYLLNAKKLENWLFWIAADLIYIPLYAWKRLELTAVVYVLFLGLCLLGMQAWRRSLQGTELPA